MLPYEEEKIDNRLIRLFSVSTDSNNFVWHRDATDRSVRVIEGSGWELQIDNNLPQKLIEGKTYSIRSHNYHRILKGSTDLKLEITIPKQETKMKLSKRQLKRIIREEYSRLKRRGLIKESMKNLYGDIQNEILYIGQEQGGELTVQDVVDYLQNYSNDPLGDPRAEYTAEMSYEEVLQIMFDMVDGGMLTGGYEDFFDVHPDYM
jgi:hypothetical protein